MELFRFKKDIPFMSWGKITTAISLITFILAVFFLIFKGLNFSVEFTGGTYRGQQGYAIGYSQTSQSGRLVFRATGSGNSKGHYGASVGVGVKLC